MLSVEQVPGQRDRAFGDGAGESEGEERAVKLEREEYFRYRAVSDAVSDHAAWGGGVGGVGQCGGARS